MTDFRSDVLAKVQALALTAGVKSSHVPAKEIRLGTPLRIFGPTMVARSSSTVDAAAATVMAVYSALCKGSDLRYCLAKAEVEERSGRKYLKLELFVEDMRGAKYPKSQTADVDLNLSSKDKSIDKPAVTDGKGKT